MVTKYSNESDVGVLIYKSLEIGDKKDNRYSGSAPIAGLVWLATRYIQNLKPDVQGN